MTTNTTTTENSTVPRGATLVGVDSAGRPHYHAGAVHDDRVFVVETGADGDDDIDVSDVYGRNTDADTDTTVDVYHLGELAERGLLDAATPDAWVHSVRTDGCGWERVEYDRDMVALLAAGVNA